MGKKWIALLTLGTIVVAGGYCILSHVSAKDIGRKQERFIVEVWQDSRKSAIKACWKIQEIAKIPPKHHLEFSKVLTKALYGETETKEVVSWIKRRVGKLHPVDAESIQRGVDNLRQKIAKNQQTILGSKAYYDQWLTNPWYGFWLKQAGYPDIDMAFYLAPPPSLYAIGVDLRGNPF